ncbi:MAG: FKBP-type peptidyl-prolyl cis-trans isomerase [Candidatus Diapherotrites archaeon]|nr:FKBP-type peptidyl-prolyl cis-trans isomerase [Candidatus Diapherotrites archaeon]
MNKKLIAAMLSLALILVLSGCSQQPPAEKVNVTGIFAAEKNNACGQYSITTQANLKYFLDLNSEFAKQLLTGDQIDITGSLIKSEQCSKITPETQKIIKRLNTVEFGAAVSVNFTLKLKDGNVISTSLRDIAEKNGLRLDENIFTPLVFKAGTGTYYDGRPGKMFGKVASAVIGMRKDEEKTIELSASEGFGEYDDSKIVKIERSKWPLPANVDPDIGTDVSFFFNTHAVVKGFDKNYLYFDLNPEYAGKPAIFWFKLVDINNGAIQMYKNVVEKGDSVKVDYTGELLDGNVFDTSIGKKPLEFVVGAGQMIQGFDNGVVGMNLGETKTIVIPPEEAYGPRNEKLVLVLDKNSQDYKDAFAEEPPIGTLVPLTINTTGTPQNVTAIVTKVDQNSITLDLNHKLAGQTLKFKVTVREIKKAA